MAHFKNKNYFYCAVGNADTQRQESKISEFTNTSNSSRWSLISTSKIIRTHNMI